VRAHLAVFLSALMIVTPIAQATEIRQFDRMAGDDQINFVDKLVDSVEAAARNNPALLAQVKRFFMKKQPGEVINGMGRFEMNLSLARIADLQLAEKNPNAHRLEVEEVMYVTLEKNGIALPKNFRPMAVNFHPQQPMLRTLTMADAKKALAETQAWVNRTVEPEHQFRPGSGPSVSGFTDNEKAIAFFGALAVLAVAAGSNGGGSNSFSGAPPGDNRMWWEKAGYYSWSDYTHAVCISNTTAAHPNC
jgi:hypothetical protein